MRNRQGGIGIITSRRMLEALAPEWDRLAEAMELPMLGHSWISAGARTLYTEDQLRIITVSRRGALAGAAPLAVRDHAGLTRLELIGASTLYEPSGLVYETDDALDALLGAMLSERKPVMLSRIPSSAPIASRWRAIAGARGLVVAGRVAGTLAVPIESGWTAYLSRLSARRRYDLRRARRHAEELGRVRVRIHSPGPHEVDGMFDDFVTIEAAGWKSRNGSSLSRRPGLRAFFREYARLASIAGTLRISFLDVGQTPVAAQISVECARRLWVLKIGYDEAWSRCSPGWQLLADTMRYAFDRKLKSYEFLGSDEPWLHGWEAEARELDTVAWYPASVFGLYGLAADTAGRVRARVASWRTRPDRSAPAGHD
jgi:CelD/BcsL family acetyltransferase involved in cellulose biosynthesis